jgi:hypothetical protein
MLIFDHDFRILTKFSKIGQHVPYVAILMEISIFIYDLLTILPIETLGVSPYLKKESLRLNFVRKNLEFPFLEITLDTSFTKGCQKFE